ncbi:uncharacterized protein LOC142239801 [Haematobia irritans]|uniref:uncharacterized protein LOC142239801 n=1 Tax=Haematobia irritans TaxID=7368 RepID=UPI003F5008A7
MLAKIKYLRQVINKDDIRTDPCKISAIKNLKIPENVAEARSVLGSINDYSKFVNNMRTLRKPLDDLDNNFIWTSECQKSLDDFKKILTHYDFKKLLLTHYNPNLPIHHQQTHVSWRRNEDEAVSTLPLTFKTVVNATKNDKVLQSVNNFINNGWSESSKNVDDSIIQYYNRKESLSTLDGSILFNNRIVVPEKFRQKILKQLHRGHLSAERGQFNSSKLFLLTQYRQTNRRLRPKMSKLSMCSKKSGEDQSLPMAINDTPT